MKSYTVTETTDESGKVTLHRRNEGFDAMELLGLACLIQREITDLIISGTNKPDIIKREVIVP